ncbi:MAG: hypothetical protein KatS3mg117_1643 [Geminicoccaceae bacterium]|jgi:hypothetical protein|nr:MAG: hypothetical protein KatS3mg117_1643 [Geminicoccaceae bacterium]
MGDRGGGERRELGLIRAEVLARPVRLALAAANDDRRRAERGAVSLARAVVGAAGGPVRRSVSPSAIAARPPAPAPSDPASALATSWLGQSLALWSTGLGVACRLPPVASGLALWRAWSELGLSGMASCAGLAARSAELAALALTGVLDAATARRRVADPS